MPIAQIPRGSDKPLKSSVLVIDIFLQRIELLAHDAILPLEPEESFPLALQPRLIPASEVCIHFAELQVSRRCWKNPRFQTAELTRNIQSSFALSFLVSQTQVRDSHWSTLAGLFYMPHTQ